MPRALSQRANQKPSRPASKATAMRSILRPAFSASSRHRCSRFSNALSSTASFFNGWRSMPGTIPATSQLDRLISMTAPLAGWRLPEEFATLRRLLEARIGKQGKREFVQVLRLMEVFRADEVAAAVGDAIARGAIGFDAVKHLVLCRIERRPPRLDMTVYPYLPQAHVAMTSAKTYLGLLTGTAS